MWTWAPVAASGVWERGYCLRIGGPTDAGRAPGPDLQTPSLPVSAIVLVPPGRDNIRRAPRKRDISIAGPSGAGHFVKMVHNGMEYGIMAAYAEGLNILNHANCRPQSRRNRRGKPTPLRGDPEHYQ